MKKYDYKSNDLMFKTIFPVLLVWSFIMFFAFYIPYKKKGINMPLVVFFILAIPYIWAIQGIYNISNDDRGQGLVIDRPACLNLDVPDNLKSRGFVGLFKPECRSAQQKIGFTESNFINQKFNYILNILFLLILIFISTNVKMKGNLTYRMRKSTTVLVFIMLLGSLITSGFVVFPWRAIVYTRIGIGFAVCAASLLTYMILGLTTHFFPAGKSLISI